MVQDAVSDAEPDVVVDVVADVVEDMEEDMEATVVPCLLIMAVHRACMLSQGIVTCQSQDHASYPTVTFECVATVYVPLNVACHAAAGPVEVVMGKTVRASK